MWSPFHHRVAPWAPAVQPEDGSTNRRRRGPTSLLLIFAPTTASVSASSAAFPVTTKTECSETLIALYDAVEACLLDSVAAGGCVSSEVVENSTGSVGRRCSADDNRRAALSGPLRRRERVQSANVAVAISTRINGGNGPRALTLWSRGRLRVMADVPCAT